MRYDVLFAGIIIAFVSCEAQAADAYSRVSVKIANSVEVPNQLKKLIATLRTAADKRDITAVLPQVGSSFFWASDHGGGFKASASPQDNFVTALNLDPKKIKAEYLPEVWSAFRLVLDTSTASAMPARSGVICLPGKGMPVNQAAATKTANRFNTDPWFGMMYATGSPVVVRKAPKNSAAIVSTIKDEAVFVRHKLRTDPDAAWEPVHLANGATGWVHKRLVSTFLGAQLCFAKGGDTAWKIVGYNGGGD